MCLRRRGAPHDRDCGGTAVLMWSLEGTHMITFSSVMFMVVMIFACVLIDIVMVFGPPENDPGVDRCCAYRPKRPPGTERDLRRSRIYRALTVCHAGAGFASGAGRLSSASAEYSLSDEQTSTVSPTAILGDRGTRTVIGRR